MLTKYFLDFKDDEMKTLYRRSNNKYYARATIICTILLAVIAGGMEAMNLTTDEKDRPFKNTNMVSIMNWTHVLIFCFACFFIRKALWF